MKTIIKIIFIACVCASCSTKDITDIDITKYVYMSQSNQNLRKLISIREGFDTTYYGASVSGFTPANADVDVNFSINEEELNSYNAKNSSSYILLPSDSYSMEENVFIQKGKTTTNPLKLIVNVGKLEPFTKYLLPIQVNSKSSEYVKGLENHTSFFIYDLSPSLEDYPRYNNSQWTVLSFSSHDPWQGGPDGNINSLLNENGNSYWITRWGAPTPHWVIVDMKEVKEIHGVTYTNRKYMPWHPEPEGFPKHIKLELSNDGETWEEVLNINDIPFPAGEVLNVWNSHFSQKFRSARYFRFSALEVHTINSPIFNLSCLSLF